MAAMPSITTFKVREINLQLFAKTALIYIAADSLEAKSLFFK